MHLPLQNETNFYVALLSEVCDRVPYFMQVIGWRKMDIFQLPIWGPVVLTRSMLRLLSSNAQGCKYF